ncbi:GNAT family N-acetyltransferase [Nocardioides sp. GY 10127]|uniref:GNAT family N-acetyltransferase n=1 Tax=Nocardioides sp. GY 10127 TaxID=2569762 RepID=UPI0010A82D4D|nr:GNAT family N-acetyltransferase [Nocardioides sp. GY 10127]TIC84125.1 GNAT family N-acetyltransferase [Nocardioides sp. GY 10127]
MQVRLAGDDDLVDVADVTEAAYRPFTLGPADPYVAKLRDTAARARDAELWVATLDVAATEGQGDGTGEVVGSVTVCPPGSPWREIARDGEGEFRMLAVAPGVQGQGVGSALVEKVLERSREAGDEAVVLSSLPSMHTAHRLYARHGFVRVPERDWAPLPAVPLVVFRRAL